MNVRPRVLLADDHQMFAEGLKGLLAEDYELVGVVADGLAMVEAAQRLRPDAIIADIGMPGLNGIEALLRLRGDLPDVRVVFLTMHKELAYARRALGAGALGYVLKHSASNELVAALQAALQGRQFVSPVIATELQRSLNRGDVPAADPVAAITPRQRQILQLLATGQSVKQIAAQLSISARTVEFHKYTMMDAAGVKNTAELIHFGMLHGIVAD